MFSAMESEATMYTAKVKEKFCFFLFFLCFQQLVIEAKSAGIKQSDVAKYVIQRKAVDRGDQFLVSYKRACKKNGSCKSCSDLSADEISSEECGCKYSSRTFLPEKGKCLTDSEAAAALKGALYSASGLFTVFAR